MKKKYFTVGFLIMILFAVILSSGQSIKVMKRILVSNRAEKDGQITIVIDPGHGGRDPGKVGVNKALEKDINLSVSLKLKTLLEQNDIKVVMTRKTDEGLYSQDDSHKKRADLDNRVDLIDSNHADLAISIHQNSFTEEYVKGAQVFYYTPSEQGKQLAQLVQAQIVKTIADGNHRKAKSNSSYYMLKKVQCPLVIIECGYMSNNKEAELLVDDEYQEKMAFAIHLAIMQYINGGGLKGSENHLQ